ncbi:hypothetical protein [Anaerosinus massiliensis]|uniref:hypothetical protein n=1 Tax=Massilibacillus massiliensis TaxID=1806837 RepID=UPI000DA60630|nr:hypothetical protein [Massilibacillus massiliensis]
MCKKYFDRKWSFIIVLEESKAKIIGLITSSIKKFTQNNPHVKVYTFGLYSCPWAGWLTINFDAQKHSEKYIENLKVKYISWDEQEFYDTFCNNCPDFEYADYSAMNFPIWQQQCESQERVAFKNSLGNIIEINQYTEGDEAINKVVYEYYVNILEELEERQLFDILNQEQVLRIGVQMLDSTIQKFWLYRK